MLKITFIAYKYKYLRTNFHILYLYDYGILDFALVLMIRYTNCFCLFNFDSNDLIHLCTEAYHHRIIY